MPAWLSRLHYSILYERILDPSSVQVSVAIPLYNYARYVVHALDSILRQTAQEIEVIVVDDVSTDNALDVTREWLRENEKSFARVVLVQNATNSGLPYSRNVAFSLSQAPYVFPIDADNTIYPRCLERCLVAAQRNGPAVVYTIIERFGASRGLMNLDRWSRDTFRRGNQVDAMALISRSAWATVGGYDPEMRLGWEDYDLWLRFCEAGYVGVQVPEILGRYRVHSSSMTSAVTGQLESLVSLRRQMEAKYPWTTLVSAADEERLAAGRSKARVSWWTHNNKELTKAVKSASTNHGGVPQRDGSRPAASRESEATDISMVVPFQYAPYPLVSTRLSIAAIIHVFYTEYLEELAAYLANCRLWGGLFVSTDTEAKRSLITESFSRWHLEPLEVRVLPNRGRDIAPKLVGFSDVYHRYECILHLHTKKSPHLRTGQSWRRFLYEHLLGSPRIIDSIVRSFQRNGKLGLVFPEHWAPVRDWIGWGANFPMAQSLAQRMGLVLPITLVPDYPSGSMFWARSAALTPLLKLGLSFDDFPAEAGQLDGALGHAIERMYAISCELAGLDWAKIAIRDLHPGNRGILDITSDSDLDWFMAQHTRRLLPRSEE